MALMTDPFSIPETLAPRAEEAAVLSLLAIRDSDSWVVVCGSLLTGTATMASMSWRQWQERQPRTRGQLEDRAFDLSPDFYAEPFPGVRTLRSTMNAESWRDLVASIVEGAIPTPFAPCHLRLSGAWSSLSFVAREGTTDTHQIIAGACRPASVVCAPLKSPPMPDTEESWYLEAPPYLKPGRELGRIFRERNLFRWSKKLLAIDWLGGPKFDPPRAFVVGRVDDSAWIADVVPKDDGEDIHISIGWNADQIDPLSCSLLVRAERNDLPLVSRQIRISDIPPDDDEPSVQEPRLLPNTRRLLVVHLPRGPRRSKWGVMLIGPDGAILDERPVVQRVEQVELKVGIVGEAEPSSSITIGDSKTAPTTAEVDAAVALAVSLEEQAAKAAAERRIASGPQLGRYLRRRFSYREGELLILDPYLFESDRRRLIPFLESFDRQIRVLTGQIGDPLIKLLEKTPWLAARKLPKGASKLHDRAWMVGDTGLLVGNSVAALMADDARRLTTAAELPFGDAALWREQFEAWWTEGAPTDNAP